MAEEKGAVLQQLATQAVQAATTDWNPPFCGEIDLHIRRDGRWWYQGTPIERSALVRLFASVLRREGEGYFLVTPVEKVGIRVDDAPFVAIDLQVEGEGMAQCLCFTTQIGDRVMAGAEHPLRFVTHPKTGEPSPYVLIRSGLEALIHRNLFYQLVELAVPGEVAGRTWHGVWSGGVFFPIAAAD